MSLILRSLVVVALLTGLFAIAPSSPASAVSTLELLSARPDGTPSTGISRAVSMSADGRFVAFTSDDPNLVARDTNGEDDVFLKNLETGELTLVSVSLDGQTPGNFWSRGAVLSATGRFVAFESGASNLVDIPNPQSADVYVRDMELGVTHLVSINGNGTSAAQGFSGVIDMTPDGRYVLFTSNAQDLGFFDVGIDFDVFVRDLEEEVTSAVNVVGASNVLGDGGSFASAISDNGRWVAFSTSASNLVQPDTNQSNDIFLRDLELQETILVSRSLTGIGTANEQSFSSVVSPGGERVFFSSNATDVVAADDDFSSDIFRFEIDTGEITWVSRRTGLPGCSSSPESNFFLASGGGFFADRRVSDDGRWILYVNQPNMPTVPTAEIPIYLCAQNVIDDTLVTVNATRRGDIPLDGDLRHASLSGDGRYVVFDTDGYLVEGAPAIDGEQSRRNVYIRDLAFGGLELLSWNLAGDDTGDGAAFHPTIDVEGSRIAYLSEATDVTEPRARAGSANVIGLTRLGRWAPPRPAGAAIVDSRQEFSYTTRISTFEPMEPQAPVRLGSTPPSCLPDTVCASGALPDRPEVLMRTVGPRGNGFFWPTMVKFTTSTVEVWVEQLANGEQRYYRLDGAQPGVDELPGLFDRLGFAPPAQPALTALSALSTVSALSVDPGVSGRSHPGAGHPEDPPSEFFTSPLYPGFEFRVRVTNQVGAVQDVRLDDVCLDETVCFSAAIAGRPEVFVRIVGPRPNGFLWPTLVKLTTSQVEVWIDRPTTGESRYYLLEGAAPGFDVLPGLFDRTGFVF